MKAKTFTLKSKIIQVTFVFVISQLTDQYVLDAVVK